MKISEFDRFFTEIGNLLPLYDKDCEIMFVTDNGFFDFKEIKINRIDKIIYIELNDISKREKEKI